MSNPKISVIIPVYNAEATLRRCVDSVLAQTFTDFECLLINDGSKDKSGEICDEYAAGDSRIRVFHKENGGVSSARNVGLDNATGEWIAFVDSDDWVDVAFLDSLLKFGSGSLKICNFRGSGHKDYSEECFSVNTSLAFNRLLNDNLVWTPWGKLFASDIINGHNLRFDSKLRLGEDTLFCWEYLACCPDVTVLASDLYNYSGVWGGGVKYALTVEEQCYNLTRLWDALHSICTTISMKTNVGIDHAKGILFSYARCNFKDQKAIMNLIAKEYNSGIDVDIKGGILWKTLLILIKARCYHLAAILLRFI